MSPVSTGYRLHQFKAQDTGGGCVPGQTVTENRNDSLNGAALGRRPPRGMWGCSLTRESPAVPCGTVGRSLEG